MSRIGTDQLADLVGTAGTHLAEVGEQDLAPALGSGDVPVLATPRVLAWAEAATMVALEHVLEPSLTSVGITVDLRHRLASPLALRVTARAEVVAVTGRSVVFAVEVFDNASEEGRLIADGHVTRAVVDRTGFLDRLPRPSN